MDSDKGKHRCLFDDITKKLKLQNMLALKVANI